MSVPPVDKINEGFLMTCGKYNFLSSEILDGIEVPLMDEAAIEDFESWSDDEQQFLVPENVEHCGGEPEQAPNGFGIGFVMNKYIS